LPFAEDDKEVSLKSLYDEKPLVIFSYPKVRRVRFSPLHAGHSTFRSRLTYRSFAQADTPGCTNQACGYRDIHSEFSDLGYGVYGLSKDKPTAQLKWKTKHTLGYSLLCDPEDKLLKKLGATAANKCVCCPSR
jgi:peroxiredoxin Q/BCP